MRNFWQETNIQGRKTLLTGGGSSLHTSLRAKVNGESEEILSINAWTEEDGQLQVVVSTPKGKEVHGVLKISTPT